MLPLPRQRTEDGEYVLKILIVKLSSLGDVVHAMPAVQDIRRALPQAQIDWVVERSFAPLALRCAGVRRVIPCELRRWRKAPFSAATRAEWRAFKAEADVTHWPIRPTARVMKRRRAGWPMSR